MAVLTLTTDFGLTDGYVGVMKGMMLSIDPTLNIVDVTHNIRPQDIRQAAYVLDAAYRFFPKGSLHICVVDPGVGSARKPLAIEAAGRFFIGPDNGVFTRIIRREQDLVAHEIANRKYMARKVSATFHGRDVFAPAAAWLALGEPLDEFGPKVAEPSTIDAPDAVSSEPGLITGHIVYVDHFGNAITNIDYDMFQAAKTSGGYNSFQIVHSSCLVNSIAEAYDEAVNAQSLNVVVGSWNTLEFFIKSGHAASVYGLCVNDTVKVRFSE